LRLQSNSQPSSWNNFRATFSRGRVFGSSFSRPWRQTLLSHRLTSMSFFEVTSRGNQNTQLTGSQSCRDLWRN